MSDSPFSAQRLDRFRAIYAPEGYDRSDLLDDKYLLAEEGPYRVYFAPFGTWPTADARVVLVGLTPGFRQVVAAARIFVDASAEVRKDPRRFAKRMRERVAFDGRMKKILCEMLDDLGLPEYLAEDRSELLFAESQEEVATTSALVYPVVVGAEKRNFSGARGDLSDVPLFARMLEDLLLPRLQAAPQALIIPFGKSAMTGLDYLARAHGLDGRRILDGLPHPSPANGHRVKLFARNRDSLRTRISSWFET